MLKKLLAAFRPLRMVDPIFGPALFQKVGFWETKPVLSPTGKAIEVLLDGDRSGPTQQQRDFFAALQGRYPGLLPTLQDHLDHSHPGAPDYASYRLVCIELPQVPSDLTQWSLSFEDEKRRHYVVSLRAWEIENVENEG